MTTPAIAVSSLPDVLASVRATPEIKAPPNTPAIVVGGGPSAFDDLSWYRDAEDRSCDVIAINSMAEQVASDHWVTAHAELIRRMRGHAIGKAKSHTISYGSGLPAKEIGADYLWQGIGPGGSSGLLATKIAVAMGYVQIYLAGVPMAVDGYVDNYRRYEAIGGRVFGQGHHRQILLDWRQHWCNAFDAGWLENVHSRAGWTKELLNGDL